MVDSSSLARIIADIEAGCLPDADARVTILPQPSDRDAGVLAFTARNFVVADVPPAWVAERLPTDDLSAPLGPPFITALCERTGRKAGNNDVVCLADPIADDGVDEPVLREATGAARHPRVERARKYRDGVRVWCTEGAVLMLGYGLAGRLEVAVEVDPAYRGHGLGRALALAARRLATTVAPQRRVWAQVAPGNAASVRAFLAAGFRPVGAETLLVTHPSGSDRKV